MPQPERRRKTGGWFGERERHAMAARGIKATPEIGLDLKKAKKDRLIKKKRLEKLRKEQKRLIDSKTGSKWLKEKDPVKKEKIRLQIVKEMDRLGDIKIEIRKAEKEFDDASYRVLNLMDLHSKIRNG